MPRKDGTGPEGAGTKTGRGLGPCESAGAKTGRGLGPCEDVSARRGAARRNNRPRRGRPRGRG